MISTKFRGVNTGRGMVDVGNEIKQQFKESYSCTCEDVVLKNKQITIVLKQICQNEVI